MRLAEDPRTVHVATITGLSPDVAAVLITAAALHSGRSVEDQLVLEDQDATMVEKLIEAGVALL